MNTNDMQDRDFDEENANRKSLMNYADYVEGYPDAEKTPFCSGRFDKGSYTMRGIIGRGKSDHCQYWSRTIGAHTYDFSNITWRNGSRSILVFNTGTSRRVHEFHIDLDAESPRADQL